MDLSVVTKTMKAIEEHFDGRPLNISRIVSETALFQDEVGEALLELVELGEIEVGPTVAELGCPILVTRVLRKVGGLASHPMSRSWE